MKIEVESEALDSIRSMVQRLEDDRTELLQALEMLMGYVGGWDCPKYHPCGNAAHIIAKFTKEPEIFQ